MGMFSPDYIKTAFLHGPKDGDRVQTTHKELIRGYVGRAQDVVHEYKFDPATATLVYQGEVAREGFNHMLFVLTVGQDR